MDNLEQHREVPRSLPRCTFCLQIRLLKKPVPVLGFISMHDCGGEGRSCGGARMWLRLSVPGPMPRGDGPQIKHAA